VKAFAPSASCSCPLSAIFHHHDAIIAFEWRKEAARQELKIPQHEVCCYPFEEGFVAAIADRVAEALQNTKKDVSYRVLFSAHGLPKRVIERGDPYQWQVERTVKAVVASLKKPALDWRICYQSRVGPLEWIGPATDAEVRRAAQEDKGLIVVPVAFVSEHSETLVELDIEYSKLAEEAGVPDYIRAPTVRSHPAFIGALASLVTIALGAKTPVTCAAGRICPRQCVCGHDRTLAYV
jgi:ferrochelatase